MATSLMDTLEALEEQDQAQNAEALKAQQQAEERRRKEAKAARDKAAKKNKGQEDKEGALMINPNGS